MPWGRLDDSLYDHPKLDALGEHRLEGIGLWAVAISWSNRRLTDGYIPAGRVPLLGGTLAIADALVGVGLFEEDEGGYRIHDFLEFNDSKVDVLNRRAVNAQKQRESRARSRGQSPSDSHGDSGNSHGGTNRGSQGTPSRPSPVPSNIPSSASRHGNTERDWARRIEWFRETGQWDEAYGPKPAIADGPH